MPEIIYADSNVATFAREAQRAREMRNDADSYRRSTVTPDHTLGDVTTWIQMLEAADSVEESAATNTGQKKLAQGAENLVIDSPQARRRGRLIAITWETLSPERAREIFYSHRVMNILFPHNFPIFYAAWGSSDGRRITGTVREEIVKTEGEIVYPIDDVWDVMHALQLPVGMDPSGVNYHRGADGGEYFLDTLFRIRSRSWDMGRVLDYMNDQAAHPDIIYSDDDKRQVAHAIERLLVNEQKRSGAEDF